MSKSNMLIIRIESADGTKRVQLHETETIKHLYERVFDAFSFTDFNFKLFKKRGQKDELISSRSKTIVESGLQHGDMVYLSREQGSSLLSTEEPSCSSNSRGEYYQPPMPASLNHGTGKLRIGTTQVEEDEVDLTLWKQDGKIERGKSRFCRHGSNGCCIYCSPLEPFDENYLKKQNIKHLSFHSYLRKLTAGVDRGKFVALENISCSIKTGCKDHPAWPKGICSKCQPNAITLNRQIYRHTDNVMFENAHLVERFLNYWRSTGLQRVGFLYGRYEVHADVPLGIRAVVSAIYEPPQESSKDSITMLPDDKEKLVEELAKQLGLVRVGWIFTDLVADDVQKGTVKHVRNIESHFLSAQECITAGYFQNQRPNPCRFSSSGYFGSKFVTVCVTGDSNKKVHMEGYQVSGQCMALVRDGCLVPTKDAPELGYVPESTDKKYIPDVFYKVKDNCGNEVPRLARPLPVEYLLVDVPASTPLKPLFTFTADTSIKPFPVENRLIDGHIQDFAALGSYMSQFTPDQFLKAVSDFHLLLYIATMDVLPMREYMAPLLEAVRNQDSRRAIEWSQSDQWATVEQVIAASSASTSSRSPKPPTAGSLASSLLDSARSVPTHASWTCKMCTFLNSGDTTSCEMCASPRYEMDGQ
ncbi:UNVERIFIED_CONTAM: hypothetical protein PYX00_001032 [Menopon gallinae]|uniref:Nuclear protein localization protein 4 homolog n=1 Tax=Menopon gallinae TaxID=328185 RepID=A0AAW2ICI8_9NEOP